MKNKQTSSTKVRPSSPMEKNTDSKELVLNMTIDTKEDYDYVYKLCLNWAVFRKFRTWIDGELNNELKILEVELFLLNSSLTIISK